MPEWLIDVASVSLVIALLSAAFIAVDILRGHRQHMWIMNIVWPVTALYAGPLGLWAYMAVGRGPAREEMHGAHDHGAAHPARPFWQSVGLAATHCGGGCTLGDILAEGLVVSWLPLTLFGHRIFGSWAIDFVLAFLIGIAFQYYSIVPMRKLSPGRGLIASLKADTLSLSAWQVGMYGWMAIATFLIFGHDIDRASPVFWFMMQIAMLVGFATSYPVNWWLVRTGIKERM